MAGVVFGILRAQEPGETDDPLRMEAEDRDIAAYTPKCRGNIEDISSPTTRILRALPRVASVTVKEAQNAPRRRIVHLLDWHYVPEDLFAEFCLGEEKLTVEERKERYAAFLRTVECVQSDQRVVLSCLARFHGLRRVFVGEFPKQAPAAFMGRVDLIRRAREKNVGHGVNEREASLQIGAPGELLAKNILSEVRPVEDLNILLQSGERDDEGILRAFNPDLLEQRHRAIVRNLPVDGVHVLVLGGDHDLSSAVPKDCEYFRVMTEAYR